MNPIFRHFLFTLLFLAAALSAGAQRINPTTQIKRAAGQDTILISEADGDFVYKPATYLNSLLDPGGDGGGGGVDQAGGVPTDPPGAGDNYIYIDTISNNLYFWDGDTWEVIIYSDYYVPTDPPGEGDTWVQFDTTTNQYYYYDGDEWTLLNPTIYNVYEGAPSDPPAPGDTNFYIDNTNGDFYWWDGDDWVILNEFTIEGDGGPPTDPPGGGDSHFYIDNTTGDFYYWNGVTWELISQEFPTTTNYYINYYNGDFTYWDGDSWETLNINITVEGDGAPSDPPGPGDSYYYTDNTTGNNYFWDGDSWEIINNFVTDEDEGAPSGPPGAGDAFFYVDNTTGNLYYWDGDSWVLTNNTNINNDGRGGNWYTANSSTTVPVRIAKIMQSAWWYAQDTTGFIRHRLGLLRGSTSNITQDTATLYTTDLNKYADVTTKYDSVMLRWVNLFDEKRSYISASRNGIVMGGDSVAINGVPTVSALKSITGFNGNGTLKKIVGNDDGDVPTWNEADNQWEAQPPSVGSSENIYNHDDKLKAGGTTVELDSGSLKLQMAIDPGATKYGIEITGHSDNTSNRWISMRTEVDSMRFQEFAGEHYLITSTDLQINVSDQLRLLADSIQHIEGTVQSVTAARFLLGLTPTGWEKRFDAPAAAGTFLASNGDDWVEVTPTAQGFVLNGGNSFAGAMTVGTNDNNILNLEVNNVTGLSIGTDYKVTMTTGSASDLGDINDRLIIQTNTSSAISAGFGGGIAFESKSDGGNNEPMGRIGMEWQIKSAGSETSNFIVDLVSFGTPGTVANFRTDKLILNTDLTLNNAGNKINITTGANASAGTATLSGGTVTVNTTEVTASSLIFFNLQDCASCGTVYVSAKSASTSFTLTSSNGADASTVAWWIIN